MRMAQALSWRILALAAIFVTSVSAARAENRPTPPNILFLFADDQRADTIAALGNSVIQTPNLDRLVKRGVAFDRAYMQGAMQGATCVPSRAMLLSGMSLFRIDEKLKRDQTWPNAFGKAGYTTFMTGKWHNEPESIPLSFQNARSVFAGGMTDPMKAKLSDMRDGRLGKPIVAPKHACAVFADEAIRFLADHKSGPFFSYVAFDAPHDPHIVPDVFSIRYDAAKMALPPNFLPQHPWDNGEMTVRDEKLLPWPRTPDRVREMNAEYYRYISYLDSQIGRILDALDASPYAKNTIVVFSADSGVARGSHGLIGKQNLYEHSIRVPLIIAGPGIVAGKRTDAMCYLFDMLPTLSRMCNVPDPKTSEGRDFSATLTDPTVQARPRLFFAYRNVQRSLSDGRWKLIRYPQVNKTQLFDLQTDPNETTNLADRPEHGAKVRALMRTLAFEQEQFGDNAPLTLSNPMPAEWTPLKPNQQPGGKTSSAKSVKVFILAGQSNMEGKAPNELLESQANDPKTKDFFAHLRKDGKWIVRNDVFIKFLDRKGPLTIGFGSPGRTGVELEFGTIMGDHFDEPVLLIKTAWGGHSLCKNFRPPSAGLPSEEALKKELEQAQETVRRNKKMAPKGDDITGRKYAPMPTMDDIKKPYGLSYRNMIAEVKDVQEYYATMFPELKGKSWEFAGFVWFQGWNDQYGGQNEYASNMEHFIRDVRKDLNASDLPFVIGVMGQNGSKPATGAMLTIQKAQLAMSDVADFKGNVKAIRIDVLVDKDAEDLYPTWKENQERWKRTGGDHGYHYYGSAIWFNRIGKAMGVAMLELMNNRKSQD